MIFFVFLIFVFGIQYINGQTSLIASNVGGFESGTTWGASNNGWTVVNHSSHKWTIGNQAGFNSGSNSVYIANSGTYSYSNTRQTSHFYKDIAIDQNATNIQLTYYWKGLGQLDRDRILVYTAPTSITPVAGTPDANKNDIQTRSEIVGATLVWTQPNFNQSNYTLATVGLPCSLAGTTIRLIFTWQNDSSTDNNPGASIDDISLVYSTILVPTFNQVGAICSGEPLDTLPSTSLNGIAGTWSPPINNTATTTYTFTPLDGNCATTSMIINVNQKTSPTFTQVATVCSGVTNLSLPTSSLNGISGTWSPTINNTTTTTYTFMPTAGTCANTSAMTITINPTPTAPTASSQTFCSVATVANLVTTSGTGIKWYSTATGGTALSSTTSLSTGTYYAESNLGGLNSVTITKTYTGGNQTFIVPNDVTSLTVKIWGAGGASGTSSGGSGGYVTGTLVVTPNENLTIIVGQGGTANKTLAYGGGGKAGGNISSGGGGGKSSIIRSGVELAIAGGGGGSGHISNGGAGGGLIGINGGAIATMTVAQGGTQNSGGSAGLKTGTTNSTGTNGSLSLGGNGSSTSSSGGGGGGGYYGGGGGGGLDGGGGAGGSSYIGGLTSGSIIGGNSGDFTTAQSAPNSSDINYVSNVGVGSATQTDPPNPGGNGLIVITYSVIECPSNRTPVSVSIFSIPNAPSATKSPISGNVCLGTILTLNNPSYGSQPGQSCGFEYQTSIDNGLTWSSTVTSPPSITATGTNNKIRIRASNSCSSGCNASSYTEYSWIINPNPLTNPIYHD